MRCGAFPSWTTLMNQNWQPTKQPAARTSADDLILILIMWIKKNHWNLILSECTLSYPSSTQLMVVYQLIKWSLRHTIWWVASFLFFLLPAPSIKQGGVLLALVVPPCKPSDKTKLWCWDEKRRREERGRRWTPGKLDRRLQQEDRGRTDTMRPLAAWTLLLFLLVQGASRACTGTESGSTKLRNFYTLMFKV